MENLQTSMDLGTDSILTEQFIAKVAKARLSYPPIKKRKEVKVTTKSGREYKFKYAELSDIGEAVDKANAENGLIVYHSGIPGALRTILTDGEGRLVSELSLPGNLIDMQALGGALTFLKRYNKCLVLDLAAEDDDDGNYAVGNLAVPLTKSEAKDKAEILDESMVLDLISQAETQEELGKLWSELNGVDKAKYKPIFTKKRLELEGGTND